MRQRCSAALICADRNDYDDNDVDELSVIMLIKVNWCRVMLQGQCRCSDWAELWELNALCLAPVLLLCVMSLSLTTWSLCETLLLVRPVAVWWHEWLIGRLTSHMSHVMMHKLLQGVTLDIDSQHQFPAWHIGLACRQRGLDNCCTVLYDVRACKARTSDTITV